MSAAALPGSMEAEALRLWGDPTGRTRRQWRWRTRGSLALAISGPKRSLWQDHESRQGSRLGQRETPPPRGNQLPSSGRLSSGAEPIAHARDTVRHHRGECSLILAATLADGTPRVVHMVRLTRDARNATRDRLAGAMVQLPGLANGPPLEGNAKADPAAQDPDRIDFADYLYRVVELREALR
jgi:hypothetical protein